MNKPSLRDEMPQTAKWIDELRVVFGADEINGQIRKAMNGEPVFYATEAGKEFGTKDTSPQSIVAYDDRGTSYSYDIPAGATEQESQKIKIAARNQANARGTENGT